MSLYTTNESSTRPLFPTAMPISRPAYSSSSSRQHSTTTTTTTTTTTAKHKQNPSPKMPSSSSSSRHKRSHTKSHAKSLPSQAPVQVVVQPPQQAGKGTMLIPPTVVRLNDQGIVQRHIDQHITIFAVAQLYRLYDNQQVTDPGLFQGTLSKSVAMLECDSSGGGGGSGSSSSSSSSTRHAAYFMFNDLRVNMPGEYYLCIHVYYFSVQDRITVTVGFGFTQSIRILDNPSVVPSGRTLTAYEANLLNTIQSAGHQ